MSLTALAIAPWTLTEVPTFGGQWIASDPTIVQHNGLYYMYYTEGLEDAARVRPVISAAVSADGLTWTPLGGTESAGIVVVGAGGEQANLEGASVFKSGDTFILLYSGYGDIGDPVVSFPADLYAAVSADGVTFTPVSDQPVLARTIGGYDDDAVFSPTVIPYGDGFLMLYAGHAYGEGSAYGEAPTVRLLGATSPDGLTWTKVPAPVLEYDPARPWMSDGVAEPALVVGPDGNYYLFFTALEGDARVIGLAVAADPLGPWEIVPEPILTAEALGMPLGSFLVGPHAELVNGVLRLWYTQVTPDTVHTIAYAESDWGGGGTVIDAPPHHLGTALDDIIVEEAVAVLVTAGGGNDVIVTGIGDDTIDAGEGNDEVWADGGNDSVLGAAGDDTIVAAEGSNTIDGGDGADLLGAGGGDDLLLGGVGNDVMDGGGGADILDGGAGQDQMWGGEGGDSLAGAAGLDTLIGEAGADTLLGGDDADLLAGGAENDRLLGGAGADMLLGDEGDDTLIGGAQADWLDGGEGFDVADYSAGAAIVLSIFDPAVGTGDATGDTLSSIEHVIGSATGADHLIGDDAANRLEGLGGNDTLDGGGGADVLLGGAGNDLYIVDLAGDFVIEAANAGSDTVWTSAGYTLAANLEVLAVQTGVADGLWLGGNGAANSIFGGSGADSLDGGLGADTMVGGGGDDVYVVNEAGDRVIEAGAGIDMVFAAVNHALAAGVENLAVLDGVSTGLALTGNALGNIITGGAGRDTLNGGAGADTLAGGAGDDRFIVDVAGDVVVELAGGGNDTVQTSVSYTLGANIETLVVAPGVTAALTLNGNTASNTVIGGAGNDFIIGGGGNDVLTGSAGNDTINGGNGIDRITGGAGNDRLFGGLGTDAFVFDAALNATSNVDSIVDFSAVDDTVHLENAIMTGLGAATGVLSVAAWRAGAGITTAGDATDRIIYNTTTGDLFYDADGIGGTAAIRFARIENLAALTTADFLIV